MRYFSVVLMMIIARRPRIYLGGRGVDAYLRSRYLHFVRNEQREIDYLVTFLRYTAHRAFLLLE